MPERTCPPTGPPPGRESGRRSGRRLGEDLVEGGFPGGEHAAEIRAAEAALRAAAGLPHEIGEGPAAAAREGEQCRERHAAADAAGDLDRRHRRHGLVGRMSSSLTSARVGSARVASTVSAMSSGWSALGRLGLSIVWLCISGVSTEPGQMAITRMSSFRTSAMSDLLNPSTACLDAVYAVPPTKPYRPARLAMLTMAPRRRWRIPGSTSRVT